MVTSGIECERIEKLREYPLVDLACGLGRQVQKADATLTGRARPADLPVGIHAQARKSQLEAYANTLLVAQRCNGLHSHTLAIEIADDSTVGCIESNVGQRTHFMSIVGARLPCGKRYYVHTLSQDSSDETGLVRF